MECLLPYPLMVINSQHGKARDLRWLTRALALREGLLSFQLNMTPMAITVPKRDERFDFYLSETRMDQMLSAEESRAKLLRKNKRSFPPPHVRICPSGYWV